MQLGFSCKYTLMDMAAKETSLDTLTQMAGEIIEEAKA